MKMGYGKSWVVSSIFILSDAAILYGIFRLAAILRNMLTPLFDRSMLWQNVAPLAQLGILFGIVVFMLEGLYPGYGLTAVKELERMSKSVTLVFFFLAGVSYLNKPFHDISRAFLLISWFLALFLLPLGHFVLRNIISRFSWYGTPVVVFGDGKYAQEIAASLKKVRRLGWCPTAILPISAIKHGGMEDARSNIAIFAPSSTLSIDQYVRILNQNFHKVILVRQTTGLGSVWVEPREVDGQLGLELHYNLFGGYAVWLKRLMDFGIGLALSILFSPLLGFLCLLVVLDSPGPIFFYQERLGKDFKRFKIIKFRTMVVDAEQKLMEFLQSDPAARAEYKKHHKLTDDPRLTRVGKWLRRYSLDELPQVLNVLKGDMSLTGPRAYMPSEQEDMGDYAPVILRIQPGLTGWWQVMGRHNTTFEQRLRLDEYYISNWSLWMDFYILMKTVWVVLGGNGA